MRHPPMFHGPLPDQPEQQPPSATITYERANGDRRFMTVTAATVEELDRRVVEKLPEIRAAHNRIVKTVLEINGEEWAYEYNSVGEIERVFRNGEVTP